MIFILWAYLIGLPFAFALSASWAAKKISTEYHEFLYKTDQKKLKHMERYDYVDSNIGYFDLGPPCGWISLALLYTGLWPITLFTLPFIYLGAHYGRRIALEKNERIVELKTVELIKKQEGWS